MNENQMKMIVPPTVGILVAGVASGICYLLMETLRKRKSSKIVSYDDSRCACCLKPFLVGRGVGCNDCGARSCRKACCRWDSIENSWFCLFCYHSRTWTRRREKWFRSFGGLSVRSENSKNFSTAKSRVYDEGVEHVAIHTGLDLAAGGRKEGDSMETVREFMEKIVEGMVGNVDDTPIDRLYDHTAYDRLFEGYGAILASTLSRLAMSLRQCIESKPATDTPTMAHTALRELVERAVDEARKLPRLGATVSTELQEDSNFSEQNYEDLLATAILNKVIEKFQNERVDDNSNVVHGRIRPKYTNYDNEIGLDEGVEEGSSSLEPFSQDDCSSEGSGSRSRHTKVRKEPLSLTIEEQIEEVTTTYESDEELRDSKTDVLDFRNSRRVPFPEFGMDIVDPSQESSEDSQEESNDFAPVDMITPVESWEENWLFQRRKIRTQSEPVSMLVPNPSADYRALIGDKDAEDTSDLSEFSAQSDDEIDDDDLIEAINITVPKSSKADENTFEGNKKILRENEKIEKPSMRIINDSAINNFDVKYDKEEMDVDEEFENIYRRNIEEKYTIEANETLSKGKQEIDESELFGKSYDHAKTTNNPKIPKTCSSPLSNSLQDRTSESPSGNSSRLSNNEPVFVDETIDEKPSDEETLRPKRCDEKSNDKIGKEISTYVVTENSKSSTMNGCLEDVSQDRVDDEDPQGFDQVTRGTGENSSNEEIKVDGDVKKIEKHKIIQNDISIDEVDSQCQSLETAKVVLTLEKPSSRNVTDNEIALATPPRPGTIAEREHKKWENAAPIENNPYTEENIQKRLLERQYARRSSSDVSGTSTKLQTSPSPPLQIVMGAGRPDFKRFGRDYYINEGKSSNGRSIETGFYTASSRPNSSMSQNSLSTGSDYEHQERSRSVETESACSTSSDSRARVQVDSRRNNFEIDQRRGSMPIDGQCEAEEVSNRESASDKRRQSLSEESRNSYEEISESERKNNKNEINARLNNRGNFEDDSRPIKRIDLRAYGFENEFYSRNLENDLARRKSERVINKLDLTSFGYDSGLRRTQSNNHIDSAVKTNSPKCSRGNGRNFGIDSNFNDHGENRFSSISRNDISTISMESLNDETSGNHNSFGRMKSAKSVPNINQICSRVSERIRERNGEVESIHCPSHFMDSEGSGKNGENGDSQNLFRKTDAERNIGNEKKSSLPSVRRLAQAFDKTPEIISLPVRRVSKNVNNSSKERPTTPEIHIVDTPRQMHSLTARSISREFREGLRQITSKQTAVPQAKIISENNGNSLEVSETAKNRVRSNGETSHTKPGKLKSNIKFWEQLHRKS